ncbi:sigma-70 family RNA polymerase sigma factor [Spirosoma sp. KCTC 42546]|uniref:RNA polymerase sigma factor n=1 Tax=Spirosoma sp. KCTC 42546 TaxID=2520506 RepID=UPI0011589C79|nr:sigma-70 family RNA polymerase sigma factor [Spirosoma sp. KCTC 42546]QDK78730.1 sigma-70 family RNA polymerase sigma factor [Spirosoma sp. KCTC 42546]
MSEQALSDDELVALLRYDNEEAFQTLYKRHWYDFFAMANRKLRDEDLAADVAQELFLRLWQKRKTLLVSNLKAYLTTSLKHLIIDHVRTQLHGEQYASHFLYTAPIGTLDTANTVQFTELTESLNQALLQLPDKTREVFILNRFEQLPIREIALRLGLSEKAIEYHLSRSLTFLRAHLHDYATAVVLTLVLGR